LLIPQAVETLVAVWQCCETAAAHVTAAASHCSLVLFILTPQAVETLVSLCGSAVVPVKKLLLWMEMARQELAEPNGPIPLEAWQKVLRDLSS
jgi:hypothetical protein